MDKNITDIPKEKFEFTQMDTKLQDVSMTTKSVGYFGDAWNRFRKNKASVVAAIIIVFIVLFALLTTLFNPYEVSDINGVYSKMRPKLELLERSGFWDGGSMRIYNNKYLVYMTGIGVGAEDKDGSGATWEEGVDSAYYPIISIGDRYEKEGVIYQDCRVDSYYAIGFKYISMTRTQFDDIRKWEEESGIQVVYPMIDIGSEYCDSYNADDANFWYRHAANLWPLDIDGRRMTELEDIMEKGLVENYLRDSEGNIMYYAPKDSNMLNVRVLYYNYYQYLEGHEPNHVFGTDAKGYDVLARLASGIMLSLALSVCVSAINLTIGTIYGAIEGYYGGVADLIMERITEIISGVPFIIVAILFQLHLVVTGKVSTFTALIFAYVLTGWLGTAYSVRTQFYRFKNQEYILAARTLGAGDLRLMFKHIFPNALGTIITSSVLVIPNVIFTEATLSFLGILNFNSKYVISLGTLLSEAQGYLATDPHILLFPSITISLLMISFNLFGNGLRDAFNPSLRGMED